MSAVKVFLKNLPNKMLMIETILDEVFDNTEIEKSEMLINLLLHIDSLREMCQKYNLKDIVIEFNLLENLVNEFLDSSIEIDEKVKNTLHDKLNEIIKIVDIKEKSIIEDLQDKKQRKIYNTKLINKNIIVYSNDIKFLNDITIQTESLGYNSHLFDNEELFFENLYKIGFDALIIDVDCDFNDKNIFFKKIENLIKINEANGECKIPLIAISKYEDFDIRLEVMRYNTDSFYNKPVSISKLLDKIDSIINTNLIYEPYRILVVDDSKTMVKFITRTLNNANMLTHVEMEPRNVLKAINDFNPDLILLDMYMPECNGQELSKIIRQNDTLTSIPIVFLSSETDLKKQLLAMQIGADDFLTKPIDPDYLVSSITTRVKRHRKLSSIMVQDSLTGLFNHTKIKQYLENTLARATRTPVSISFAMIDIDFFKKVNDTYGHPTGDRVIKSLAKLLQRRLRKTDVIGRYGGEEFAVIFWDASVEQAADILNEIRNDFQKIKQQANGSLVFNCTFSAGVASFPDYHNTQSISSAADKALYEAKKNGRNNVIIATTK